VKKIPSTAELSVSTTAPVVTVSPTVSELLARIDNRQKVRPAELAQVLAAIAAHIEHGAVPAHFEPIKIFDLIGQELVDRETWSKLHNAARAEAARSRRAEWQRQADELRRKNPRLSPTAIAKRIAGDHWEAARKVIFKPQK
jgi:hypothetical protein